MKMIQWLTIVGPLTFLSPAFAVDRIVRDVDSLVSAVRAAQPGDRILIEPGDYVGSFYFRDVRGTAERPIIITAKDSSQPPHFRGKSQCLHFSRPSHIILSDLELSSGRDNGLNIDDGGEYERPAVGITLRNLRIHDIGQGGNNDAIKLSGLNEFRVEHCTIERWSKGGSAIDMVGCHQGLIQNCTFAQGGSNALQMKGGSADIIVRSCTFREFGQRGVNLGGATGDPFFRPPLAKMPINRKYEARNLRVEGCIFIGGESSVAFVGVDGAVVRFNTLYHPTRYALRILQEKNSPGFVPCRDGLFQDNIVVFRSERWGAGGVNIGPDTAPKTFRFARNVWYCEDRPDRSQPTLPTPSQNDLIGQDPQFLDPTQGDFRLKSTSPAQGRGAHALPTSK